MEIVRAGDDLRLVLCDTLDRVGPLAGRLDGGLDRLGAAVHQEGHLHAGQPAERLAERTEHLVVKGTRREGHAIGLILERLDDLRVPMALIERGVGGQHVHVAVAVRVVDPDPFTTAQDHRQGMIVMRAPCLGLVDEPGARFADSRRLRGHAHGFLSIATQAPLRAVGTTPRGAGTAERRRAVAE